MQTVKQFFHNLKDNINVRNKLLVSIVVFFSSVLQGWSEQQVGVALPVIQILIGVDEEKLSTIFVVWNVGYVIGSLTSGILFDRYNRLVLMFLMAICLAIGSFVLPYCSNLTLILVCRFINGVLIGGIDTGSNTIIPTIWQDDCGPFAQLLYVFYSVGGILAPFATIPFVSHDNNTLENHTRKTGYSNETNKSLLKETDEQTNIHTAFLITSLLFVLCAILYAIMSFLKGFKDLARSSLRLNNKEGTTNLADEKYSKYKVLIVIMAVTHALSVTTEDNLTAYLITFSVDFLEWSELNSAKLMTSYWISSCCFGIFGMIILKIVEQSKILWFAVILLNFSIGSVILGYFITQTWLIWVGFISCGCSTILIAPVVFPWSQKYACPITGKVSSVFNVMSGITSGSSAYLIGYIFERQSKLYFLYILLTCTVLCFTCYAAAHSLRFKCCFNGYNLKTKQSTRIQTNSQIVMASVISTS